MTIEQATICVVHDADVPTEEPVEEPAEEEPIDDGPIDDDDDLEDEADDPVVSLVSG
ncbi:hypothetical protein [Natrarchaeobaculum sulfurireducens]|uniref:Uncharacterized protein n=1 Tax=Natrarchaeobaculum sulfurireducens TaxID=2044521 RepID=A0A346PQP4_9EURY|nr:hypothetical protein [Natrarchaeobaculum sulfurireducens]AXR81839.1 hypothetical protein AArcMg_1832 [Natrarchaeobaculum sulfurireducens]